MLDSRPALRTFAVALLCLTLLEVACKRTTTEPAAPAEPAAEAPAPVADNTTHDNTTHGNTAAATEPAPPAPQPADTETAGATAVPSATTGKTPAAEPAAEPASTEAVGPVVVYCSVDQEFAEQVFAVYLERTGVEARVIFDSEAGKTTGLVKRIQVEADAPRADVFWSSELFNTILLARAGLLAAYESPAARDIPARYVDVQHRWTAMGLRARVVAYDPTLVPPEQVPQRWEQLGEAAWAPHVALANPLFGTTRGHVGAMFALWGEARGTSYLTAMRDAGALIADGNSSAVRAVIARRARFAMTDTDDVWVAQRAGASLELCYPDMGDGGTLLIPNSVALLANCPHPDAGRQLVDFLVSAEVERLLAESTSRNIPVRPALRAELGLELPPETKLSFDAITDAMQPAIVAAREILLR